MYLKSVFISLVRHSQQNTVEPVLNKSIMTLFIRTIVFESLHWFCHLMIEMEELIELRNTNVNLTQLNVNEIKLDENWIVIDWIHVLLREWKHNRNILDGDQRYS